MMHIESTGHMTRKYPGKFKSCITTSASSEGVYTSALSSSCNQAYHTNASYRSSSNIILTSKNADQENSNVFNGKLHYILNCTSSEKSTKSSNSTISSVASMVTNFWCTSYVHSMHHASLFQPRQVTVSFADKRAQMNDSFSVENGQPKLITLQIPPVRYIVYFGVSSSSSDLQISLRNERIKYAWWLKDSTREGIGMIANRVEYHISSSVPIISLELQSLINALEYCLMNRILIVKIFGTSELLLHYLKGEQPPLFDTSYHTIHERIDSCIILLNQFLCYEIELISVEDNVVINQVF